MAKSRDHFRARDLQRLLVKLVDEGDAAAQKDIDNLVAAREAVDDAVRLYKAKVRLALDRNIVRLRPHMRPCHREQPDLEVKFDFILY
jgi:hypothetical protein